MNKTYNCIGTMSGTSFDGIDVSLAKTNGKDIFKNNLNLYEKFDSNLKSNLKILKNSIKNIDDLKKIKKTKLYIDTEDKITLLHIKLIKKLILQSKDKINLIGFHGITLFHNAIEKISFQMGNISKLSKSLKLPIIYNFRQNDLNNGGQGAPLAPIFHKFILHKLYKKNYNFDGVVNIGGISNISYLKQNKLYATDIGPGNCLLDEWCRFYFNIDYDKDGKISNNSKPDIILANNYIDRFSFQKNTSFDFNDFSISEFRSLEINSGLATLAYISAHLVLTFINEKKIDKILLAGGGRKNISIIKYLKGRAFNIDQYNLKGDFIESQAFAYLAVRSLLKLPISFPETTGVKKECTGGEFKKV